MADGRHVGKFWKCYNTPTDKPTWTKLGWSHPTNTSTAKLFSWYWSYTANRERSGFMGCRDQKRPQF